MDFSMKMDWKNEIIRFQNPEQSIANVNFALTVFLRFSVRNVTLENMRFALARCRGLI